LSIPKEVVIFIPERLDLEGALSVGRELSNLSSSEKFIIDFSKLHFSKPFGLLYLSSQMRKLKEKHASSRFLMRNFEQRTYESHMDFFDVIMKKYPEQRTLESTQYIPIIQLAIPELQEKAVSQKEDIRDTVEKMSEHISSVLIRSSEGDLHDTLSYSLREIFRNVIEHSEADKLWYAAQYWPGNGQVELAILDEGIGIRKSLRKNPRLTINSDLDAIKLARQRGISGIAYKGKRKEHYNQWANTGYGLYMTSKLCANGGSFFLASGESGLLMSSSGDACLDAGIDGTILRLEFDISRISNLSIFLKKLLK
jgi:anti-anti-sigma regulatory factor